MAANGHLAHFHYPTNPQTRWGWNKPAHPIFTSEIIKQRTQIKDRLSLYGGLTSSLSMIRAIDPGDGSPYWNHSLLPAIDAISIVGMIAEFKSPSGKFGFMTRCLWQGA